MRSCNGTVKEIVPCNPGRGEVGKKYHRLGNCGVGIFSKKVNMIGAPDSIQYFFECVSAKFLYISSFDSDPGTLRWHFKWYSVSLQNFRTCADPSHSCLMQETSFAGLGLDRISVRSEIRTAEI